MQSMGQVALYVPSRDNRGRDLQPETRRANLAYVVREMASRFGGATQTEAVGAYLADSGDMITERVTIVRSFVFNPADDDAAWLRELACYVGRLANQESMAIEHSGTMELVNPAAHVA
jgi:hypothetical protein